MIDPDIAAKLHAEDLLPLLIKCVNAFHQKLDDIGDKVELHISSEKEMLRHLLIAFPNEDLELHRREHVATLQAKELRNRIVCECLIKITQAGVLAGCAWLLYAIGVWFKFEFLHTGAK